MGRHLVFETRVLPDLREEEKKGALKWKEERQLRL